MAVCVNKKQILYIHAKWLHDNGYYKEFKDCLNQAKTYDPYEDVRQIRWGKKLLKRTSLMHQMLRAKCH